MTVLYDTELETPILEAVLLRNCAHLSEKAIRFAYNLLSTQIGFLGYLDVCAAMASLLSSSLQVAKESFCARTILVQSSSQEPSHSSVLELADKASH